MNKDNNKEEEELTIVNKLFKCSLIVIATFIMLSSMFLIGTANLNDIVDARLFGYNSTDWQNITTDPITGALITMTMEHYEVHQGDSFKADDNDLDLDTGENLTLYLRTTDNTKLIHMFFDAVATGEALVTLREDVVTTENTGAPIEIFNRDRNSATVSVGLNNSGVAGYLTFNPTMISYGTIIHHFAIGNNKVKAGGTTRDANEFILKQNSNYTFEITSIGTDNVVQITLNWYEHISNV